MVFQKFFKKSYIIFRVFGRNYFKIIRIRDVKLYIDKQNHSRKEAEALCYGYYEEEESKLILQELKKEDQYFEIGGGIGFNAILATRIATSVSVIEANPKQINKIQRNAKLNRANFKLYCGFLGNGFLGIPFYSSSEFWSSNNKNETNDVVFVGGLSVDIILKNKPTFLVIDIEGGELELIPELFQVIVQIPRILIVEFHPDVITEKGCIELREILSGYYSIIERQVNSNVYIFK